MLSNTFVNRTPSTGIRTESSLVPLYPIPAKDALWPTRVAKKLNSQIGCEKEKKEELFVKLARMLLLFSRSHDLLATMMSFCC